MQRISFAAVFAVALFSTTASAHMSITSGPAFANKSGQKISVGISHGCGTADTIAIKLDIPTAFLTSVRPLYSDFGIPTVEKVLVGTTMQVSTITWNKTEVALAADEAFYELTFRARVADVPFTSIPITVTQTCQGVATPVVWTGTAEPNPAPILKVVPQRQAGWNKVVLTTAVTAADLGTYFGDALIVWRGNEAFSSNQNTMAQIGATTGVTVLAGDLSIGEEIWVKY